MTDPKKERTDLIDNLVVVHASGTTFLGELEGHDGPLITLRNAFPIGSVPAQVEGGVMRVPQLGTLHWCQMEPVARLSARVSYMYRVKDQRERSREMFADVYTSMMSHLDAAREKTDQLFATNDGKIQVAGPEDQAALEAALADPNNPMSSMLGKIRG